MPHSISVLPTRMESNTKSGIGWRKRSATEWHGFSENGQNSATAREGGMRNDAAQPLATTIPTEFTSVEAGLCTTEWCASKPARNQEAHPSSREFSDCR